MHVCMSTCTLDVRMYVDMHINPLMYEHVSISIFHLFQLSKIYLIIFKHSLVHLLALQIFYLTLHDQYLIQAFVCLLKKNSVMYGCEILRLDQNEIAILQEVMVRGTRCVMFVDIKLVTQKRKFNLRNQMVFVNMNMY